VEWAIENETAEEVHVWVQLFLGTWEPGTNRRSVWFASLLAVKIALVVLPLPGIVALYYGFLTLERRVGMKFMELLSIRDAVIKARILGQIPPDNKDQIEQLGKMLEEAFQQGSVDWAKTHLPIIVGEDTARKIVEDMESKSI
jgi:hypothetical protein